VIDEVPNFRQKLAILLSNTFHRLPDEKMCVWQPVANKLYQGVQQSHAKIACDWGPVALHWYPHGNCTREAGSQANFIHVACDWRPHRYNLHATGSQSGMI